MSQEIPKENPQRKAWEAWKETDDYDNVFEWAEVERHRGGSLWAAFNRGWEAREEEQEAIRKLDGAVEVVAEEKDVD